MKWVESVNHLSIYQLLKEDYKYVLLNKLISWLIQASYIQYKFI
jgi:hypothetical protein